MLLLGLFIAVFGLVKLIEYSKDLVSFRRTSKSLRDIYYAAPAAIYELAKGKPMERHCGNKGGCAMEYSCRVTVIGEKLCPEL